VVAVTRHDAYDGLDTLVNPEDLSASPYGWLSTDNKTQFTNTTGNNIVASMPGYGPAPQSSPGQFLWNYSLAKDARADNEQKNAAIVNAFYLANTVHDVTVAHVFGCCDSI
jgi:extracellular elastinolytic metalloproteinase